MGTIEGFFNIDWKMFAITLFVVLLGFQAIVKVVSWYDNEMSYTAQMVRTAKYLMEK